MSAYNPDKNAAWNVATIIMCENSGLCSGEPRGIRYPGVPSVDDVLAKLGVDGKDAMPEAQWIEAYEIVAPD